MGAGALILHLTVAIAVIIGGIIWLKLNAAITMVMASIYLGMVTGLGALTTVDVISTGFGNMLAGIGIPIGFGIILGQLLSDTGGAQVIAEKIMAAFPPKYAQLAVSIAGFVLSIPVFFDVTFVILIPIGLAIASRTGTPIFYITGGLALGAATAHATVPPTPTPLAAAEIMQFDLGQMILFGGVTGFLSVLCANAAYRFIHDKFRIWNPEKDVNHSSTVAQRLREDWEESVKTDRKLPSVGVAVIPIVVPLTAILLGTGFGAVVDETPMWVNFVGDKTIAMLLGTLAAYAMSYKYLGRNRIEDSVGEGLKNAGVVMLITGAGGSFAAVIAEAGIGDSIVELLNPDSGSVIGTLFLAYAVAAVFRIAQGSGTVAGITALQIMAPVALALPISSVWVALACLAGCNSIGHVNDSGFWVSTNLSGLTVTGGLKTYTLGIGIATIFLFIFTVIGALVIG